MSTFQELGLNPEILRGLEDLNFVTPTEIQQKAIPILCSKVQDFIGLAQTGTGKTAAFGLPLLQILNQQENYPQCLIVCPTRELCVQIVNEITNFKKYLPKLRLVAVYGGTSIMLQIKDIKRGVHIVVATPGRLIDLIERKCIDLNNIKYVVLDEADEMLNMGFQDDIELILKNTPKRESTWLFSATMPPQIKAVSKKYMNTPVEVTVGKVNTGNKNIDHQYFITQSHHKYEALKRLIDFNPDIYGIIFTRTKLDAQNITAKLTREGYDIDALHGDLTQGQRDKVMGDFRHKTLKLLVATDVAARGIDVQGITHVINYELPDDMEVYTHRSGRTGRAGNKGICMSIILQRDLYKIRGIEKLVQATFYKLELPNGTDVCRKKFFHFMETLLNADISNVNYQTYLPQLEEKFADISKAEILQRVVSLEFNRFLQYYENAEDLNVKQNFGRVEREGKFSAYRDRDNKRSGSSERKFSRSSERESRYDRGAEKGRASDNFSSNSEYTKLFVNLGTKDGFYKASLLQYVLDMSDVRKEHLGKVDLKEMNTWIEIDNKYSKKMILALDGKNFKGRRIRMNEANSR